MLRIAMLGVWHVHAEDYYRQLRANEEAQIVAVWDEDPEVGRQWAEDHDLLFEANLDALLAGSAIDAVVCSAPTTRHGELLCKCAEAGKHIFTEKLLATNTAEAEKICDAIDKANIICTLSLPLIGNANVRYAKQMIESGALGRITGARMRRSHGGVSDNWLPERWFDVSRSGGGAMMDLGAHPVYVLAYLLGAPKRVSAMMTNLYGTSSDENAIALVEFDGGVLATCETAFVTYGVPDLLEVYGTDGSVYMHGNDLRVATKAMASAGVSETRPTQLPEALPFSLNQFIDACATNGPAPANLTARDALTMTKIIEAAYHADQSGETQKL